MSRYDLIAEAMRLLSEAGVDDETLRRWEERAIRRAAHLDRCNRAQQLLPFGAKRAADAIGCSIRNVYYLAKAGEQKMKRTA